MTIDNTASTLAPTKQQHHDDFIPDQVQGRRLPPAIIDAQAAVIHPLNCLDLTARTKQVLKQILGFFNVKKAGVIFPGREVLGECLGMPASTLRRHLVMLENKGYIERMEQRRKRTQGNLGRAFSVAPIQLTTKALVLAGLTVIHKSRPPKMSDDYKGVELPTKDLQEIEQGRPAGDGQQSRQTVPEDLQSLVQIGVLPQGIFALMNECKTRGKRLSDVVADTLERILAIGIKGASVKRYLSKAIASTADHKAIVAKRAEDARVAAQGRADAAMISAFKVKYAGKTLRSPNQREMVHVAPDSSLAQHRIDGRDGILPLNRNDVAHLLEKIERGQLVEQVEPFVAKVLMDIAPTLKKGSPIAAAAIALALAAGRTGERLTAIKREKLRSANQTWTATT